jgi:hypothetical protein
MITYTYIVRCPECEDEFFDFFDEAKDFAMGCLTKKPIITQTEVNRNDFGECTDYCDLGTVWSWEDMMSKETDAEPAISVFTKDDLKCMADGTDPEFDNLDNSVDFEISEGLGDFDDFDIGPQSDEFIPPEFEDAFEDSLEPVEEAISKVQADYLSRRKPMTKEEFAERLEVEDEILIFTGDPRELGIRGRDYFATKVDGKYEVSFWDETYEDEFTDSEIVETFDTIDELWDFMVNFMENDDFNPEYNYLAESCITEDFDRVKAAAQCARKCYDFYNALAAKVSVKELRPYAKAADKFVKDTYGLTGKEAEDLLFSGYVVWKQLNEETQRKPIPEGMTIEQLVEEMEENEDTVECTKCGNLVEKANCRHNKEGFGWCCSDCEPANTLIEEPEKSKFNPKDIITFDYSNFSTEVQGPKRAVDDWDDAIYTTDYTYEKEAGDVADLLYMGFLEDEDVTDVPGGLDALTPLDKAIWQKFWDEHFNELLDKYYDELYDCLKDSAREEFEENASWDDYEDTLDWD